jgi:hypothetical protein
MAEVPNPILAWRVAHRVALSARYEQRFASKRCDDCGISTFGGPMLRKDVWATIGRPDTFLCFGCTERRLGRQLTQADLAPVPFNIGWIKSVEDPVGIGHIIAPTRRLLPKQGKT